MNFRKDSDQSVERRVKRRLAKYLVDLLKAQVYAGYINEQGGSYLKTEFGSEHNPTEHTRRILGLDGRRGRGRPGLDLAAAVEGTG